MHWMPANYIVIMKATTGMVMLLITMLMVMTIIILKNTLFKSNSGV